MSINQLFDALGKKLCHSSCLSSHGNFSPINNGWYLDGPYYGLKWLKGNATPPHQTSFSSPYSEENGSGSVSDYTGNCSTDSDSDTEI